LGSYVGGSPVAEPTGIRILEHAFDCVAKVISALRRRGLPVRLALATSKFGVA